MIRANIRQYKNVNQQSQLTAGEPHQVILALMRGALETMALIKGAMERKQIEEKAKATNKAIGIIVGLQDGIDLSVQPEIGENFYQLYDYMIRRLGEASAEMSIEKVDEVIKLLSPVKDAWEKIPEAERQKAYSIRQTMPAFKK